MKNLKEKEMTLISGGDLVYHTSPSSIVNGAPGGRDAPIVQIRGIGSIQASNGPL